MIEIAEAVKLEILHVHYALPWAVAAHLAREVVIETDPRLKIVTTLHGTDITVVGAEPSFFKMTKFGIERSDALTAVSGYLAEETRKTFGVNKPIEVIYNSVDFERFNPRNNPCCRKHFASQDEKILVHVSNFRPVKRVLDAVRIFAQVASRMPARLLMVGDGPDLPAARKLASELQVCSRINFLGNQEAVEPILSCADLFVLPSAYESFGLAALEAMSCGLPVIATDAGGLKEVIRPGVDGWLCEVGDHTCMAERAIQILSDEATRQKMGKAGRERAIKEFAPERIVPQYEQVYLKVLSEG
jgi:N-acetyl-alpha-D-glucosaminyl L-malate synthase BshA